MELAVGFLIALIVGLTGVGAGSVTAPVLMLFFGMSPVDSVGTALAFATVIKIAVLPVYLARKQVNFRILALLSAGGIPGVIAGFFLLEALNVKKQQGTLFVLLGATIVIMAIFNGLRTVLRKRDTPGRDRSRWLPPIAAAIGAEVGFSSAGAGALGSAALLSLTTLAPAQVVGTDMVFGLLTSVVGGGFHLSAGHFQGAMLMKLIAGGVTGAVAGATLSGIVPSKALRVALSIWLVIVGLQLCWRAVDLHTTVAPAAAVAPVR